jgi:hypothetical protein
MGTPHKVINPATGRRVLKKGKIGRQVTAKKKRNSAAKSKCTKGTKGKCTKGKCKNGKCKKGGPVKGRYYGVEGATKYASPIMKRAGKTKNYACRPSARASFDRGDYDDVIYDGRLHKMAYRRNGSPYYQEVKKV